MRNLKLNENWQLLWQIGFKFKLKHQNDQLEILPETETEIK